MSKGDQSALVTEASTRNPPERPYVIYANRAIVIPSRGMTIGRSVTCDLVVDDPGGTVSRTALFLGREGRWVWVADRGTSGISPVKLNGRQEIAASDRITWINDGDVLLLGGHTELKVATQPGLELPAGLQVWGDAVMSAGSGASFTDIKYHVERLRATPYADKTVHNNLGKLATQLGVEGQDRGRGVLDAIYHHLAHQGRPVR